MTTYDHVLDDATSSEKRAYWDVAFGLQKVDNLTPSAYVQELAKKHIKGEKSYATVVEDTTKYYENPARHEDRTYEADVVAEAICAILSDRAFRFDVPTFKSYHYRLFEKLPKDVYHAGEFRTVNLTKKEAVLNGKTVQYQDYGMIEDSLEYDFNEERTIDYLSLSPEQKVQRLATFTSRIWQVHPFYEGNTRTAAVFIEKYLLSLGYQVDNEVFKEHSKAFRDALVLANYTSIPDGVQANPTKLYEFFKKMLES